jgi:hypothetical protein
MWLFGKKKKRVIETVDITGEQLFIILQKMILSVKDRVNNRTYIVPDEILFDFGNYTCVSGVKYNKKKAKADGIIPFDESYISFYIDDGLSKTEFTTLEEFKENAKIDKLFIKDIGQEIKIFPEDAELLQ